MNPFEMVVLIVAIVVAGRVLVSRYARTGAADMTASSSPAEAEELRAEIRRLKDRVAVLERLATDDTARLDREIEKLRDQPYQP